MLNEDLVWLLKQFQLNHLQWICIPLLVVCQQVFIVLHRNVTVFKIMVTIVSSSAYYQVGKNKWQIFLGNFFTLTRHITLNFTQ